MWERKIKRNKLKKMKWGGEQERYRNQDDINNIYLKN